LILKNAQRRAAVVTASILASIVVFLVVVEVLKRNDGVAGSFGGDSGLVRIIFYAISISMVFVANLVNGFMLRGERSDDIVRIAARLSTVSIVVAGLSETPLILGFVLFVGWGYATDFYILGFVSFYLMLRHFPFYGQWEKYARERMGNKWPAGPVSG
jgi:hypothetical protein